MPHILTVVAGLCCCLLLYGGGFTAGLVVGKSSLDTKQYRICLTAAARAGDLEMKARCEEFKND